MTMWVLHEALTAEEEARIQKRNTLTLPFEGMPDLSMITSQIECRHLLQALHAEAPPEVIGRKTERVWKLYSALQLEDIIVVPLQHMKELAIAEITERYKYGVGNVGEDVHQVGVKWHDKRLKQRPFGKHNVLFEKSGESMREISDPQVRTAIRDQLPHSYNRFAKWKWLLILFFLMGLLRQFERFNALH